ncbi:ATP-binding SpoIIE family protein phosphatase [Kineococcus sp. SYSU DK006]|uniref:ATP-binding SpoIIE family protein phosphatase n=1 Tax=Kineococcus sp. SYSU DK006 TaxID=3383127 RepID=UPI003D7D25C3
MLDGLDDYLRALTGPGGPGDLPALLRRAARAGRRLLGAEHCVVWCAPAPGRAQLYLVDGDVFLDLDRPPFAAEAAAAAPVHLPGREVPGLPAAPGSALCAPMGGGRGAVLFTATGAGRFGPDAERTAAVLALALGTAVQAALASAAERTATALAARAALLERVTDLLQTSATRSEITARVPVAVCEVLECRSAALVVVDDGRLVGDGHPPHAQPAEVALEADDAIAEAVRTRTPVVTRGGSALVVPLFGRDGDALGALAVDWGTRSPLGEVDLELFAGVAAQLSVALERAQLLDAEREARADLARSTAALAELARDLQSGMLPRVLPQRPELQIAVRYSPALAGAEIGGDWYDAVATEDGVVLVIGDVQGHSTRAAALMGQLRTAVRAYVSEGHDPGVALARTNSLLVDLQQDLFATCCLLRLDTGTGVLTLASAGHPAPLVVDDGGLREAPVDPGPPLGVLAGAEYPTTTHRLHGRGAVVLHTDGVVEVLGVGSEEGEAALRSALLEAGPARPAEALATALLQAIPHALTDDAALLVTTYAGAGGRPLEASAWLPPDVRSVASGRELLRARLVAWSAEELLDEAELVLSELVTNALVHAGGGAGLTLRFDAAARRLTIAVRDRSPRSPLERAAGPEALGGRGLGIVEAVADDWGVQGEDDGKTVWAHLAVEV